MIERTLFKSKCLPSASLEELQEFCNRARRDILLMTTLAGSGHPGGSMSSLEIFALLWSQANVRPGDPYMKGRDRIIASHGHTSPGVYAVLGRLGFFDLEDAIVSFRKAGSLFEGHLERSVPGVELTTGNLGQGLSSACGMMLSDRANGYRNHTWVITGDGENQKGQMVEARRFATAFDLTALTVVIDRNRLQITGHTCDVMPVDFAEEYKSDGWQVQKVDGHDLEALFQALRPPENPVAPRLVIAETVMGKGVSFMENDSQFHGKALTDEQLGTALAELGCEIDLDAYREKRAEWTSGNTPVRTPSANAILNLSGNPRIYPTDHIGDNRSAFGNALLDLARANRESPPFVFDCDLAGSVKTEAFSREFKDCFFQCGITEHHTASAAAGASIADRVVFWAGFGVFTADETYNQNRLNDINMTNLKVVATHCGLDVGQDGKTHHCIKYINLMASFQYSETIVPADPNQTDRAIRYAATHPGNFFIAMGRSKLPVITREDGKPFFGEGYKFVFGKPDHLRTGTDVAILSMGNMCHRAIKVRDILAESGISAAVYGINCPHCIRPGFLKEISGFPLISTYEDHDFATGLGAFVALELSEEGGAPPLMRFGVVGYGLSGDPEDLYRQQGLLPAQVAGKIKKRLGK